jgi:hypothetical protein
VPTLPRVPFIRLRAAMTGLTTLVLSALTAAPAAGSIGPAGYTDPEFGSQCSFHRYGEGEAPPLSLIGTEPLCVEYAKRDITVNNGGAVRFLLAEPARFAVAVPACRYWQLDHWSVQAYPGGPAVVGWDGSYWFDKSAGTAALKVRNVKVAGRPATAKEAARAVRPYDPRLADALQRDAGGLKVRLPAGAPCARARQ